MQCINTKVGTLFNVACLCLDCCNSFSRYRAIVAEKRKKDSQKIDDLPVLVTCRSGTSVMLSSKFNGPVTHGSTR